MQRSFYFGLILVSSIVSVAARGAERLAPVQIRLPGRGFAFAVADDTVGVAFSDPTANVVELYPKLMDGSLDGVVKRPVGAAPTSLVHKKYGEKGYFLVGCEGDSTLQVLDDVALKPIKVLHLSGNPTSLAAPSDPSVPYVYVAARRNGNQTFGLRIDLRDLDEMGEIRFDKDASELAVSANGRYLYARMPEFTPNGFRSYVLAGRVMPDGSLTAAPIVSENRESQAYVPDFANMYTACGSDLYSTDLKQKLASLPVRPLCFLPDHPVALAIDRAFLEAFSTNSFQKIGSVRLPPPPPSVQSDDPFADDRTPRSTESSPGQTRKRSASGGFVIDEHLKLGDRTARYRPAILVGRGGKTILICQGERVVMVSLSSLRLPDEPMPGVIREGATSIAPGERLDMKVTPRDPRVTISLATGPAGLKFDDGHLRWTPTAANIGTVQVVLDGSAGELKRSQSILIDVARHAIPIPFFPREIVLSPDYSAALISGDVLTRTNAPPPDPQSPRFGLAILDLKSWRIVAHRALASLPARHGIAIDSHFVYVGSTTGDWIDILDRGDLHDVRRIFTNGRPDRLEAVDDNRLYIQVKQGPCEVFTLPELLPVKPPALPNEPWNAGGAPAPVAVGENWFDHGVLWDHAMVKPLLLIEPSGFLSVFGTVARFRQHGDNSIDSVAPWGTLFTFGMMQRTSGQKLANAGNSSALLTESPAAVAILHRPVKGPPPHLRTELGFHELVSGEQRAAITLVDEPVVFLSQPNPGAFSLPPLEVPGKGILVSLGQRVYLVGNDEIRKTTSVFPMPLHFLPKQDVFLIDPAADAMLKPTIAGGRGKITFANAADGSPGSPIHAGIEVDADTGRVLIHAGAFDREIDRLIDQTFRKNRGQSGSGLPAVDQYRLRVGSLFERITGHVPRGVPMGFTVAVVARDEDQQMATQAYTLIMDVDPGMPLAPLPATFAPPKHAMQPTSRPTSGGATH